MDQRSSSALFIGLLFISAPFSIDAIPIEIEFTLTAQLITVLYGALMIVGGLYSRKAKRYKFMLDIYSVLGLFVLLAGPLTNFPLGLDFWNTISFVSAIFLGLPTVLLLKLNR